METRTIYKQKTHHFIQKFLKILTNLLCKRRTKLSIKVLVPKLGVIGSKMKHLGKLFKKNN